MELLRGIVSLESRYMHADQIDLPFTPIVITPGKYRPLTLAEISAGVKDTSPAIPDQCTPPPGDGTPLHPDGWKSALVHLNVFRQLYGPHVHVLTRDMARQFMGSPVYCLGYHASSLLPCCVRHRSFYSREELMKALRANFFYDPSSTGVRLGHPIDGVAYYDMSSGPNPMEPLGKYHTQYPVDRSGIVMQCIYGDGTDDLVYVLAEKLD